MSNDSLLLMLPGATNWQPAVTGTAPSSDTATGNVENPAQFLQALLAQMQRGDFQMPEPGKAPDATALGLSPETRPDLAERLKALLANHLTPPQTAVITPAPDAPAAKTESENGNSLPLESGATQPAKLEPTALASIPEQMLAYLAQWMTPQPTPTAATAPATEAPPPGPTPAVTGPDPNNGLPSAELLALMLQAAGLKLDPPAQPAAAVAPRPEIPTPASALAQPALKTASTPSISLPAEESASEDETEAMVLPMPIKPRDPGLPVTHADFSKTLSQLERAGQNDMGLDLTKPQANADLLPAMTQATERAPQDLKTPPTLSMDLPAPLDVSALNPPLKAANLPNIEQPSPIQTPVGHPDWSSEIGDRIVWMAGKQQGLQSAEIKLNPAHLGPVEVRVNISQDQASVQFVSNHAAVREALESAVPKLREMLHGQNLNLADVNVSQQSFNQQQQRNDSPAAQFGFERQSQSQNAAPTTEGDASPGQVTGSSIMETPSRVSQRLLSLYA